MAAASGGASSPAGHGCRLAAAAQLQPPPGIPGRRIRIAQPSPPARQRPSCSRTRSPGTRASGRVGEKTLHAALDLPAEVRTRNDFLPGVATLVEARCRPSRSRFSICATHSPEVARGHLRDAGGDVRRNASHRGCGPGSADSGSLRGATTNWRMPLASRDMCSRVLQAPRHRARQGRRRTRRPKRPRCAPGRAARTGAGAPARCQPAPRGNTSST